MKSGLVVSAHPGDFVWRAGGAIALHARKGYRVKIVCLAFGERGESQFAWKQPGMTLDKVKAGRKDEAERAAAALGAEIEFFDAGDYPLRLNDTHMERLTDIYRELNPGFVLTHSLEDPYNVDHPAAAAYAQEARIVAQGIIERVHVDERKHEQVLLVAATDPEQRLFFVEIGAIKRIAEGNDPSRFSAAVANLKFHRRHRLKLLRRTQPPSCSHADIGSDRANQCEIPHTSSKACRRSSDRRSEISRNSA